MTSSTTRQFVRRQLDEKLATNRMPPTPSTGWIRTIRDALGMSATDLANRLDTSQPNITQYEKSEVAGNITMKTLIRVAEALNCRLEYVFTPINSLEQTVMDQAQLVARSEFEEVDHTMQLENQLPTTDDPDAFNDRVNELKNSTYLWREPF